MPSAYYYAVSLPGPRLFHLISSTAIYLQASLAFRLMEPRKKWPENSKKKTARKRAQIQLWTQNMWFKNGPKNGVQVFVSSSPGRKCGISRDPSAGGGEAVGSQPTSRGAARIGCLCGHCHEVSGGLEPLVGFFLKMLRWWCLGIIWVQKNMPCWTMEVVSTPDVSTWQNMEFHGTSFCDDIFNCHRSNQWARKIKHRDEVG